MELEVTQSKLVISPWLVVGRPSLPSTAWRAQVPAFLSALFNIRGVSISAPYGRPRGPP